MATGYIAYRLHTQHANNLRWKDVNEMRQRENVGCSNVLIQDELLAYTKQRSKYM